MTVAACILAASPETALRDVDGTPNASRLVETAWAGGALPVVVVAPDPDGTVAVALAGSQAVLGTPAPLDVGPVGQICRAIDIARGQVDATTAALVWPASFGWIDAETVTTLIEAHGASPDLALRAAFGGEAGFPFLVPIAHLETLRALGTDAMPDVLADALMAAVPSRLLDLGDPGATHTLAVARADLPPFAGPPEPPPDRRHEWGATAAAQPDSALEPTPVVE